MVAIEVTAPYAVEFHHEGAASTKAPATASQTAFVGVLVRGLTLYQSVDPGSARSRENANSIREFAVTLDMPQNSWATIAMSSSSLPPVRPIASTKICAGGTAELASAE